MVSVLSCFLCAAVQVDRPRRRRSHFWLLLGCCLLSFFLTLHPFGWSAGFGLMPFLRGLAVRHRDRKLCVARACAFRACVRPSGSLFTVAVSAN